MRPCLKETDSTPFSYGLQQNYPNPFNPSTTIHYILGKPGYTTLKVYNLVGKEIRTLVNAHQTAGEYSVAWDGKDNFGRRVASGVYVVTLESGSFKQARRMTLLK